MSNSLQTIFLSMLVTKNRENLVHIGPEFFLDVLALEERVVACTNDVFLLWGHDRACYEHLTQIDGEKL